MSAAATTQARLTIHDQLLVNLCGWLITTWGDDANLDLVLNQLRRVLPSVSHHHPLVARLADAALGVVRVVDAPGGRRNLNACTEAFEMRQALHRIFMTRAAQAVASIWPAENSQPETATASEPAHAPN